MQDDLLARFNKLPSQEFFDNLPTWDAIDRLIHANVDLVKETRDPSLVAETYFTGLQGTGPMQGKGAPTNSFKLAVIRSLLQVSKSKLNNPDVVPITTDLPRIEDNNVASMNPNNNKEKQQADASINNFQKLESGSANRDASMNNNEIQNISSSVRRDVSMNNNERQIPDSDNRKISTAKQESKTVVLKVSISEAAPKASQRESHSKSAQNKPGERPSFKSDVSIDVTTDGGKI